MCNFAGILQQEQKIDAGVYLYAFQTDLNAEYLLQ